MLKAAKVLIAISYASLITFLSTFGPHIWNIGFDVRPVRVITVSAYVVAAVIARLLVLSAIHLDNVARGIVAPFPYTTYPGIDSPSVDSHLRRS